MMDNKHISERDVSGKRNGGPVGHCCEAQRSWRMDSIVQATSWSSMATVAPAVTSAFQVGNR